MDRRLIFRHRARTTKSAQATGLDRRSAALEMPRLTVQRPGLRTRRQAGERCAARRADSVESGLREKPWAGSRARPYRKPTLVAGYEHTKGNG